MCSLIQVYVLHKLFCSVSGFVCNSDIQHSIFWQLFIFLSPQNLLMLTGMHIAP